MNPSTIFLSASAIVVFALAYALIKWVQIRERTGLHAKTAAGFFVACFALYVVGQSLVIVQVLGYLPGVGDVSSYMYALAAILFAIGSYYQYKSVSA
jgi:hypothetical protein